MKWKLIVFIETSDENYTRLVAEEIMDYLEVTEVKIINCELEQKELEQQARLFGENEAENKYRLLGGNTQQPNKQNK